MDDIIESTATEVETTEPVERTTQEVISEQLEMFDEENIEASQTEESIFNEEKEGSDEQQHENRNSETSDTRPTEDNSEVEQGSDDGRSETQNLESEDGNSQQLDVLSSPEYTALNEAYLKVAPAEGFLNYIEEQGLSEDDVHRALELATLYNTDPERALEYFQPLVNDLQAHQGGYLYPEIQDLVDEGEMTEAAAFKYQQSLMTQARMQENQEQQNLNVQQQEQYEQQQQEQEQQAFYDDLQSNANSWESHIRSTDLDYDVPLFNGGNTKGQEVLMTVTHMVNTQGHPTSIEQQNDMLKVAYESVNMKINSLRGGSAIKAPPRSGSVNRSVAKNKKLVAGKASTRDIISQLMGLTD